MKKKMRVLFAELILIVIVMSMISDCVNAQSNVSDYDARYEELNRKYNEMYGISYEELFESNSDSLIKINDLITKPIIDDGAKAEGTVSSSDEQIAAYLETFGSIESFLSVTVRESLSYAGVMESIYEKNLKESTLAYVQAVMQKEDILYSRVKEIDEDYKVFKNTYKVADGLSDLKDPINKAHRNFFMAKLCKTKTNSEFKIGKNAILSQDEFDAWYRKVTEEEESVSSDLSGEVITATGDVLTFSEYILVWLEAYELDMNIIQTLYDSQDQNTVLKEGLGMLLEDRKEMWSDYLFDYIFDEVAVNSVVDFMKNSLKNVKSESGWLCGGLGGAYSFAKVVIKLVKKGYPGPGAEEITKYYISKSFCNGIVMGVNDQWKKVINSPTRENIDRYEFLYNAEMIALEFYMDSSKDVLDSNNKILKERCDNWKKFILCDATYEKYIDLCMKNTIKNIDFTDMDIQSVWYTVSNGSTLFVNGNDGYCSLDGNRERVLKLNNKIIGAIILDGGTLEVYGEMNASSLNIRSGKVIIHKNAKLYTDNLICNGNAVFDSDGELISTKSNGRLGGNIKGKAKLVADEWKSVSNLSIDSNSDIKISGNMVCDNALSVNGSMTIDGDFTYTRTLAMKNADSYLCVGGTMYADGCMFADYVQVNNGTIELKGDLDAKTHSSNCYHEYRFYTQGNAKVVFSGTDTQKITSMNSVLIANMYPQNEKITTDTGYKVTNLCDDWIFANDWNNVKITNWKGHTVHAKRDVIGCNDTIDGKLIVDGELKSSSPIIDNSGIIHAKGNATVNKLIINKGQMLVDGDFTYKGTLTMENADSYLCVGGTMYADGCMWADYVRVNNGTIELKGDLDAKTHSSTYYFKNRFYTLGNAKVVFSGENTQKISSIDSVQIANMYPENEKITTDTGYTVDNLCDDLYMEAPSSSVVINEWNDYNVIFRNVDLNKTIKMKYPSNYYENKSISEDGFTYTYEYCVSELSKPIMNKTSGSILEKGTKVSFITKKGVDIYYTIDGSLPDLSSDKYEGSSIIINEDTIINAIAVREGVNNSHISKYIFNVKRYNIQLQNEEYISISSNSAIQDKRIGITFKDVEGKHFSGLLTIKDEQKNDIPYFIEDGYYFFYMPASNVTVDAEYINNIYNIIYNESENCEFDNYVDSYEFNVETKLPILIKKGYIFEGWTKENSAELINKIASGTIGDIELWPRWSEKNTPNISFDKQRYLYDGNKKIYDLRGCDGEYKVEYFLDGERITDDLVNANVYDVLITRLEDEEYKELSVTIKGGLEIYICNHENKKCIGKEVPPTCTTEGITAGEVCSVCGKVIQSQETVNALGHDYGKTEYTWNDDYSRCTAEKKCRRDGCNEKITETVNTTNEVTKAPTCKEKGTTTYTATFTNELFETQIKNIDDVEILTTHTWDEGVITKDPKCEEKGVKTFTCKICGHTKTEDVEATGHTYDQERVDEKYLKSSADCTHKALYYKSCDCGGIGSETFEYGDVLGHSYETPTYTWSKDGKSCTAKLVCTNDVTHVVTENAAISNKVTKASTCKEKGTTTYTATFTNELFETQIKNIDDVEILTTHTWDEGVITKDPKCEEKGIKIFTCTICGETKTEDIEAIGHTLVKTNAQKSMCEDIGNIEYYTCSRCGKYFSDDKGINEIEKNSWVINGVGHDFGTPTYIWSEDGKTCEARVVCKNDETHFVTEKATITFKVTEVPTCKEKGTTTYTATFTNELFETQIKTIDDIEMLTTHTAAEAVEENIVEATCETEGYYDKVVYCSVCGKELSREKTISASNHDWGEWTVKIPATEKTEGLEERVCKNDARHIETRTIPMLTHTHIPVKVEAKMASCTGVGNIEYWTCEGCDKLFADSDCKMEINVETTIIEKTEHTPNVTIKENEVAATCNKDGHYDEVVKCSICGEEISRKTVVIPATIHEHNIVFVDELPATCSVYGIKAHYICNDCGLLFEDKEGTKPITDKMELVIVSEHKGGKATCKHKAVCEVCNEEYGELDSSNHEGETEVIGKKDATCTADGFTGDVYCKQCGGLISNGELITATGHKALSAVVENKVEAICEEEGSYDEVVYCSVCGEEMSRKTVKIAATSHDFGEWHIIRYPTETAEGIEERVCKRDLTHKETRNIAKLENKPLIDDKDKLSTGESSSKVDKTTQETNEIPKLVDTPVSKNSTLTDENTKAKYIVLSSEDEEPKVEYKAAVDVTEKTVTIFDSVVIKGVTYKVTEIADNAFADNKTIEKVVISNNIESIGNGAFSGCTSLKNVKTGNGVTEIGDSAFEGCKKLKSIKLGTKVTEIGDNAFTNCTMLTKVTIPAKVRKLGGNVFKGNKNLKMIIVKTTRLKDKTVNKNAFKGVGNDVIIKVPKKMKKTYIKLFRKKGLSKKVKIK